MIHKRGRSPTDSDVIGTYAQVYNGTRAHTSGGLTKADLIKNKRGVIVSKRKSIQAKKKWSSRRLLMAPPFE